MVHSPTISIVTPSFNQGNFIEETINSVLAQQGKFFIDYIIMDGMSTDNTLGIIRKYDQLLKSGKLKARCRGIRFRWLSEKDDGQSDAINKGFSLAEGSILGWLNSDDVYYPGALQRIASINWQKTDFCYGKGMWISRYGKDICLYPTFKPSRYAMFCQCTLCQPAVFFSRAVMQELGDLSQEYFCAFDYDFWIRAVMKGKKFTFIPEFLAKSRMYPQNKSLSAHATVTNEIGTIKKLYYEQLHLNKFFLKLYCLIVNWHTNKQVQTLSAKLTVKDS
jgi:glycosyltransferase involved in cell wall biosynthesis